MAEAIDFSRSEMYGQSHVISDNFRQNLNNVCQNTSIIYSLIHPQAIKQIYLPKYNNNLGVSP